jgi:hypothetical protein
MVEIGPYPPEASFYPEHLIIPFITLAIFLVLLYVLASIRKHDRFHFGKLAPSDSISLVTLIIAIVSPFVIPFSQLPIIDYSVTANPTETGQQGGDQTIKAEIHIYGIIPAKNLVLSMSAKDATFGTPISTPFLAKHLTYNLSTTAAPDGSQIGNALVGIDVLPARSHTILEIPVSTSPSNQTEPELTTFVKSDIAVGYHQTIYLLVFYTFLSLVYVGISLYLVKKEMEPLVDGKETEIKDGVIIKITYSKVRPRRFILIGGAISAGIIFATVLLNSSYFFAGALAFSVQSFIGIVGFPLLIIITTLITINL